MESKEINLNTAKPKAALRNPSMDILRILAFSLVVSVHFFLQSKFYTLELVGPRLFIMTVVRSFSLICVPLFMILSGFLMKNKTVSGGYYKGINKTLVTYFLASIVCYLFWNIYFNEPYGLTDFIGELLSFRAAKYSWYIEMYIGLFLLIPFINLIYNNLASKKHKQILILTLFILTSLSSLNIKLTIIPTWWNDIYPLTYYFIGAYIREYSFNVKKIYIL